MSSEYVLIYEYHSICTRYYCISLLKAHNKYQYEVILGTNLSVTKVAAAAALGTVLLL